MKTCLISSQLTRPAPRAPGRGSCEPETHPRLWAVSCPLLEVPQGCLLWLCAAPHRALSSCVSPVAGCPMTCWDPRGCGSALSRLQLTLSGPAAWAQRSGGSERPGLLPPLGCSKGQQPFPLQGRYADSPAAPCPLQLQFKLSIFLRNVNLATNSQQFH